MITIGRINTRNTSRTHMALNGRTFCGTGRRAPIRHEAQTFRNIDRATICKGCFTPANLTIAQAEVTSGRFRAALDNFLCDVRLIIGYGPQTIHPPTAPVIVIPVQPVKELSAWGVMANGFRKTHPQRVAA